MKKELKVLIYSMINNLVISITKVVCGFIYGMSSLFADGLHSFSDFITDIICLAGSHISKKKPTKEHPFGFGKVEYLTNLFVGIILFLLGIFILINSFEEKTFTPPLEIFIMLSIVLILKFICIYIMHEVGKDINSQLLITQVEESKSDLISTIGVIIISIILQFSNKLEILKYSDMIGSILIGLYVIVSSIKIIYHNSLALIGETEIDKDAINKVDKFLSKYKDIRKKEITLIKYGSYYRLQLIVELNPKLTLRKVINLENKIKREITRHYSLKVKYITIYVTRN